MNLAVVGAGYVGLVTATVFAELGNYVSVIENDQEKLAKLSQGKVPFYEPGLEKIFLKNRQVKRLKFTSSYQEAVSTAEIIFICVGTPDKDGEVDLTCLYQASKAVAEHLCSGTILVIKSTAPPGINRDLKKWMQRYTKKSFELASVPEFLREGKALEDTLHPSRVVIGAEKKTVVARLLKLHKLIPGERVICDSTSAQMIKYASNAFLPTKITFANSIAFLCDYFGADVKKVMQGVGLDKRIGPDFLQAGLGYGGSCFPKDIQALIRLARKADFNFTILKAVQETNEKIVGYFLKKIIRLCHGSVKGKTMTVLGLAFKAGTSDMRYARSIPIIKGLQKMGAKIRACDPAAIEEAKKLMKGVRFFTDPYIALKRSEALILVTEWDEFKKLNFTRIKVFMKRPVVIDGRNLYNRRVLEKLGFSYGGIGT